MKKPSYDFNVYVLNLIIALQKGSRLLNPYSKSFKQLGYDIFAIEKKFTSSPSGDITPEIILTSKVIGNTLLFESTQSSIDKKLDKKSSRENQLTRYKNTELDNLKDIAAIPAASLLSFDIPFIVNDSNSSGYIDFFSKNPDYPFPLLVFNFIAQDNLYCIKLLQNTFSNQNTHSFFSEEIKFERLNLYIPFELNNPNKSTPVILSTTTSLLLRYLNKSKAGTIFTTEQIASEIFSTDIWKIFEPHNKTNILRVINTFIDELLNMSPSFKTNYFKKVDTMKYEICISDNNKDFIMKSMNKRIFDFAQSKINPNYAVQQSLFENQ